MNNFEGPTHLT